MYLILCPQFSDWSSLEFFSSGKEWFHVKNTHEPFVVPEEPRTRASTVHRKFLISELSGIYSSSNYDTVASPEITLRLQCYADQAVATNGSKTNGIPTLALTVNRGFWLKAMLDVGRQQAVK